MNDIGKELYERVRADFERRLAAEKHPPKDMRGVSDYSARVGRYLAEAIAANVTEDALPDRRLYYNIAESILEPSLRANYELVNDTAAEVQRLLDERQGLRIKPARADYPAERVHAVIGAASEEGIEFDRALRRMTSPAENITQSFADDFMQANAEQRSKAGFDTFIERQGGFNCCPWCAGLVGVFAYPKGLPKEVFARHDNCTCSVTYGTKGGARQNVWTKAKWDVPPVQEPHRMTVEEAAEKGGFDKPRRLNLFNINSELDYMSNSIRLKYGSEESSVSLGKLEIPVYRVTNSNFEMYVATNEKSKSHAVRLCEKYFRVIQSKLPSDFGMPKIVVLDFEKYGINSDAIGGYHRETDSIFMNSRYDTPAKVLEYVNRNPGWFANKTVYAPYLHELGHKYYEDCIKRLVKSENIEYNKAKGIIDRQIYNFIEDNNSDELFLKHTLSGYANDGYQKNEFTEIVAESFTVYDNNSTAADIMKILREGEQNDDTAD